MDSAERYDEAPVGEILDHATLEMLVRAAQADPVLSEIITAPALGEKSGKTCPWLFIKTNPAPRE